MLGSFLFSFFFYVAEVDVKFWVSGNMMEWKFSRYIFFFIPLLSFLESSCNILSLMKRPNIMFRNLATAAF